MKTESEMRSRTEREKEKHEQLWQQQKHHPLHTFQKQLLSLAVRD